MCIGISGKVVAIEGEYAKVMVQGNILEVAIGLVETSVGDQLLIHAGCAVCVVSTQEAEEMALLMRELEEVWDAD